MLAILLIYSYFGTLVFKQVFERALDVLAARASGSWVALLHCRP